MATLALSACGGVQLEGKAFDMIGLGSNSGSRAETKLTERSPLVVPPSTAQLPAPGGNTTQVANADPSFPQNPEEIETRENKVREAALKKKCDEYFRQRDLPGGSGKVIDESLGEKCASPLKGMIADGLQ